MKKLNKKGVSLAELLAVVVIMGIIAAIAIPLVGNVIETSKRKAVLGDATTLVEAASLYCMTEDPNHTNNICKNGGSLELVAAAKKGESDPDGKLALKLQTYVSKQFSDIGATVTITPTTEDNTNYTYKVTITASSTQKYATKGAIDPLDQTKSLDDLVPAK